MSILQDPGDISFNGYDIPRKAKIVNNGHSAKVEFTDGQSAPWIAGGRLPTGQIFELLQFHWHWGSASSVGSEHTLNGRSFPMELHLVHWNTAYGTVANALNYHDGLAVIGFFYEVSPANNTRYDDITAGLLKVRCQAAGRRRRDAAGGPYDDDEEEEEDSYSDWREHLRQDLRQYDYRQARADTAGDLDNTITLAQLLPLNFFISPIRNNANYYFYEVRNEKCLALFSKK